MLYIFTFCSYAVDFHILLYIVIFQSCSNTDYDIFKLSNRLVVLFTYQAFVEMPGLSYHIGSIPLNIHEV